eukprot:6484927-Pyramimonas_sp.AAC.1
MFLQAPVVLWLLLDQLAGERGSWVSLLRDDLGWLDSYSKDRARAAWTVRQWFQYARLNTKSFLNEVKTAWEYH